MVVNTKGVQDYYFDKFEETISCNRPVVNIRNLVLSTLYIDFNKDMYAVNHATGERAILNFVERGWTCDSSVTGTMYDADGVEKYKITGSWMNKLVMTNIETKEEFVICEEPEQPKDMVRQHGFSNCAIQCNYINDEMRAMLPPSDTRLRGDQRLWEEGKEAEADEEKVRLEVKQRKNRKQREETGQTWEPAFFEKQPHPFIEGEEIWKYRTDNCYWEKRESNNWEG